MKSDPEFVITYLEAAIASAQENDAIATIILLIVESAYLSGQQMALVEYLMPWVDDQLHTLKGGR